MYIIFIIKSLKKQLVFLRIQKGQFSERKLIRRTMESTPERAVNYLQFIDCTLDATKQNEELQDRPLH